MVSWFYSMKIWNINGIEGAFLVCFVYAILKEYYDFIEVGCFYDLSSIQKMINILIR